MDVSTLLSKRCKPYPKGSPCLQGGEINALGSAVSDWAVEGATLIRTFSFSNYHETMAFVNAVAFIAHREDHHPDLEVSYKRCKVTFSTHSVGGLSDNDFICAAKIDALI